MKRRDCVSKGLSGVAALPWAALHAYPSTSKQISLKGKLTGREADWTFVGGKDRSVDKEGILCSPVWTYRKRSSNSTWPGKSPGGYHGG